MHLCRQEAITVRAIELGLEFQAGITRTFKHKNRPASCQSIFYAKYNSIEERFKKPIVAFKDWQSKDMFTSSIYKDPVISDTFSSRMKHDNIQYYNYK